MAKRLLLNILVDVLDDYVEGLSVENLKLGVLSGKIELNNLQLKRAGVDKLNLPISVTHGSLKKLQLKIPWTALESKPVRVIIDGLYLQAGPFDVSCLSAEQLRNMAFDAKRARLKAAEDAVMAASQTPEGIQERTQKASYIQQLTAKIVDNIEITLTNVHIRYEDSMSVPGNTMAAGITIASISLATTDDQWNEAFVARVTKSKTTAIHKLGRLENLGVYWNTRSKALGALKVQEWEEAMQNLIYLTPHSISSALSPNGRMSPKHSLGAKKTPTGRLDNSPAGRSNFRDHRSLDYILAAPNSLHVKIVHKEYPMEGEPKIDMTIESTSLSLNLDKTQYQQLIAQTIVFSLLEQQKQLALLRPHRRPTRDPRGWWHYAYKLVTGRTVSTASKMDVMIRCMKVKRRYIALIKRSRYAREAGTATSSIGAPSVTPFTALDESELRRIEETIPVQALLVFRQFAAYEMVSEAKREERELQKEGKGKNIMASFGWTTSGNSGSSSGAAAGREKGPAKSGTSSSSVSSWFKNLKKSKRGSKGEADHGDADGQGQWKKEERIVEEEDERDEEMDDDERLIEIIQSRLDLDPLATDQFIFRLVLNSSAALRLTSETLPVALLEVALSITTEMKADGLVLKFALDDFQLIDECTLSPLSKYLIVSAAPMTLSAPSIPLPLALKGPVNPFLVAPQSSPVRRSSARKAAAADSAAPKLLLVIDSRHGKTLIRLTARPMEATWNELCVGRLLGIFMAPDVTQGTTVIGSNAPSPSSTFNPLLAASLNKFKIDAALPIAGDLELIIEIDAPKIIIPDDCYRDAGCMLFDMGYLVVRGIIGETSMQMDISLSNVNVGMPLSVDDKHLVEGRSLYLIRPFDVKVAVQTLDPVVADVTVAVSVSPGLEAELDAVKVARLIRHINTIVSTIQEALDPGDVPPMGDVPFSHPAIPSIMLVPFRPDTVSGACASKDRSVLTAVANRESPPSSGAMGYDGSPSPTHCWVDVTVDLPYISMKLFVTDSHSVTFLVSSLDTHVLVRQHDLQLYFALKSLKLLDSLRGADRKAIIFTPPLSAAQKERQRRHLHQSRGQGHRSSGVDFDPDPPPDGKHSFDRATHSDSLISLCYTYMYSRQSPLFKAHGQEMRVEFTSLGLSIDEEALLRLKPFLEMLAKEMAAGSVPAPLAVSVSPPVPAKVAAVGPKGMLVTVSVGSVSLLLMRSAKHGNSKLFSPILAGGSSVLEGAFSMEITDMFASIDMQLATAADVRLRSFTVLDCRPVSENYVYKEMLCRSTLGSQHNSVAYSSIDRAKRAGPPPGTILFQEENSDILTVTYREESRLAGTVEVELRNITSFISVDSVIELIDVAMCNVTAALAVASAFSGDGLPSGDDTGYGHLEEEERPRSTPLRDSAGADRLGTESPSYAWLTSSSETPSSRAIAIDSPSSAEKRLSGRRQMSPRANSARFIRARTASQSSISPSHGRGKETAPAAVFLMNVIVSIVSPRLLLLEDPESADSRAIVLRSGVSVHFCSDSKAGALTLETLHISLQTLEIFALTGLTEGRPQQIVEPTGIELHVNRKLEAAAVLSTTVSLDVDVVIAKISVNDVVLANSILSRASIASKTGDADAANGGGRVTSAPHSRERSSTASSATPLTAHAVEPPVSATPTMYDFVAQLGSISLVAINDFNGQTLPILRLSVEHSDFRAGGQIGDLQGEGSFHVSAEHYNTRVAVWEPLLERWGPRLSVLSTVQKGTVVEVTSDSTLQLNVSGAMVKTFSQLLNLTSTIQDEFQAHSLGVSGDGRVPSGLLSPHSPKKGGDGKRTQASFRSMLSDKSLARGSDSPVTFRNSLEFPIEVFDGVTHETLMVLRAGESAPLVSPGSLSRSWIQSQGKYPTLFDIRILGRLKEQRLPLLQLPLNINKPRPYCLQPNLTGPGGLRGKGNDRSRGTEPIVEEAFENQRYNPLERGWANPWADLNDPPTWTDILGAGPRNPSSVRLPSDRWEWIEGDWKVDLSGLIGVEIDEKGWEYATNFTSFSVSKRRRAKKPMDVVRRRRWIRSRMPKSSASDELLRALSVIWDVRSLQDGSRVAEVRSGLQVKNLMPFPLSVAIDGFPGLAPSLAFSRLGEGDQDSCPPDWGISIPLKAGSVGRTGGMSARIFDFIPEGESFSLPLLLSSACMMRVRPSGRSHQWSKALSCRPNNSGVEAAEGAGSKDGGKDSERSKLHHSYFRSMAAPEGSLQSARDHHDLLCPVEGEGNSGASSVCMQGLLLTADRSRLVACVPYATCHNHLPCDLSYQFLGGDGHSEQGSLSPGASGKLASVNLASRLLLSVQVGDFAWSAGQLVDAFSEERQTLDLYPQGAEGRALSGQGVGASLSTMVTLDHYQTAHIKIFSRFALVDKSGLDISVRTRRVSSKAGGNDVDFFNTHSAVERHTYGKRRPLVSEDAAGGREREGEGQGRVDLYADFDDGDKRSFFSDEWDRLGAGVSPLRAPHDGDRDSRQDGITDGLAGASWTHGAHGLVLFHSDPQDSKFSLGVKRGAVWSESMSLLALGASKVPFELVDKNTSCAYQLAHCTTQLPGAFKATQLVTVMPCYCVVNCLGEHIELRQVGALISETNKDLADFNKLLFPAQAADLSPSRQKCSVAAKSSAGWHRHDVSKGTAVQLRCKSSAWSLGTVDLNQIGTTVLLVPKKRLFPPPGDKAQSPRGTYSAPEPHPHEDALVLHVEVRFADPSDSSYVNIVVWAPVPDKEGCCHKAALSVRNDTMYPITIQQTGTDSIARERRADPSRFSFKVPSGAWKPFGWADPCYGTSVTVTLDVPPSSPRYEGWGSGSPYPASHSQDPVACEIDILKIGQSSTIHLSGTEYSPHGRGGGSMGDGDIIDLTIKAVAGGQVLHVTMNNMHNSVHSDRRSPSPRLSITDDRGFRQEAPPRDFTLVLSLKSVGVSLIAERPVRREFISLYMDGIEGRMVCRHGPQGETGESKKASDRRGHKGESVHSRQQGSVFTSYELEVSDMQIDNYSETAVFPVLMHSFSASHRERKKAARRRKRAMRRTSTQGQSSRGEEGGQASSSKSLFEDGGIEDCPFLALSVALERTKGSDTPIFKYVAVRLLEIKLAVDSSTLQLYFCDLHGDLRGESRQQAQAGELPVEWARQFNQQMVASGYRARGREREEATIGNDHRLNNSIGQLVDLPKTLRAAQEGKMYFETLIIHPMKLRLSFLPTPFPRSKHEDILSAEEYRGFKIVRAIAQVDELVVKISCFQLTDTMDSLATLGSRVLAKTLRDLHSHLVQIVGRVFGSLEFIGKPAGLYRNVGEGVKEFFYEPYEGLMHSPEAFVAGLGKGTGGLMRGVVSGAITSTAAIVGSATKAVAKGVGAVSGDKEFVRQREEKRRINTASSGGVLSGMRAGSESVFSGFASGITGLVTRPFEEGRRGGALGFVKGIGLGMAGAVTKPILGVSDGIASLVHGISNQVSDAIVIKTARPRRAFDRSATDIAEKVLVPLDLAAAHAQEFVLRAARRGGYTDSFISHISIDGSRHGCFSSTLMQSAAHSKKRDAPTHTGPRNTKSNKDEGELAHLSLEDPETFNVIVDGSSVVVSELFVFVLRRDESLRGRYAFGEMSHCAFQSDSLSSSVHLVLYQASSSSSSDQLPGGNPFDIPFNLTQSPHLLLFGDSGDSGSRAVTVPTPAKKKVPVRSAGSSSPTEQTIVIVQCSSKGAAVKLYGALAVCAAQMGNPSSILPADVATAAPSSSSEPSSPLPLSPVDKYSSSSAMSPSVLGSEGRVGFQGYRFGTANSTKHTFVQCSEKDLLLRIARRLSEPVPSLSSIPEAEEEGRGERGQSGSAVFAKFLDQRVWQSVSEWRSNHQQLQSSRCLAVLLINQSDNPVQILRTEVQEGRNVLIFGVSAFCSPPWQGEEQRGYDEESRTLRGGGGAAVVFAFGFLPTLIDLAHVKVNIVTSAFNATVSTRPNRTLCVAVGGYTAGYLEKSLSDFWAKYVIAVN